MVQCPMVLGSLEVDLRLFNTYSYVVLRRKRNVKLVRSLKQSTARSR
jgi:hypothetical protein